MSVNLIILEGVKIKDYSLKMHNQNIRGLSYELSFLNIDLLLTVFAPVIINNRTLNHLLKTFLESSPVLNLDSESIECFQYIPYLSA